jgi:hypothetical protein
LRPAHARDGSIADITYFLEKGPSGREPTEEKKELHHWFIQLDSQGQIFVRKIVQEAIDSALFSALVILDGAAGGYPVEGSLSDFALYLQTYRDEEGENNDSPMFRVKLNPWQATEDLHDIFRWQLEDR